MEIVADPGSPNILVLVEDGLFVTNTTIDGPTRFVFTQSSPAASWNIVHNLDTRPTVTILVLNDSSVYEIVDTDITYVDLNTVYVVFASPVAGFAYLL